MVGLHGVVRGATREMAKARDDDFSFAETRVARFQAALFVRRKTSAKGGI